jgi:hypothetical protein
MIKGLIQREAETTYIIVTRSNQLGSLFLKRQALKAKPDSQYPHRGNAGE